MLNRQDQVNFEYTEQPINDTSIANDTLTNVASFTLKKGMHIVQISSQFNANANGYRQMGLGNSPTQSNMNRFTRAVFAPISGALVQNVTTYILNVTDETQTFYVNIRQTSGSTLTYSGGFKITSL